VALRELARARQAHEGYDKLYVPRMAWTTGDLDVHDVALDGDGRSYS
jgi:hypothetical protein